MWVMGDFGEFLSCPLITAGLSMCTLYPEVRFRSFPLGFVFCPRGLVIRLAYTQNRGGHLLDGKEKVGANFWVTLRGQDLPF